MDLRACSDREGILYQSHSNPNIQADLPMATVDCLRGLAEFQFQMRELMKPGNFIAVLLLSIPVFTLPALGATAAALAPGAKLQVRITDRVSSDTAKPGDIFRGTLAQPVVVNGKTVFEKGTDVKGQVLQATSSGRLNS